MLQDDNVLVQFKISIEVSSFRTCDRLVLGVLDCRTRSVMRTFWGRPGTIWKSNNVNILPLKDKQFHNITKVWRM